MKPAGRRLLNSLVGVLDTRAPGAHSLTIQRGAAWILVLVQAADDIAAEVLAAEFGCDEREIGRAPGVEWLRLTGRDSNGTITVTGPHVPTPRSEP